MTDLTYETVLMRCALSSDPATRGALATIIDTIDFRLDPKVAKILDMMLDHHETTGEPISANVAPAEYKQILESLEPIDDPSAPFWAAKQLRRQDEERVYSGTLVKAMEILKVGDTGRKGLTSSVDYLLANMPSTVDADLETDHDLRVEYETREANETSRGLPTGLSVIDELTDGHEAGELWVIGAYTGQGKSFILQNIAYHRRIEAGLTGIFWSTEQHVAQIKRRLVIRHSLNPKFGAPDGLSYTDVKRGRLDAQDRALYLDEVLPDWNSEHYPPLLLRTAPAGSTLESIMRRTEELNRQYPLDYVIIDYLSMLRPAQATSDERIAQTRLFIGAKSFALNFDGQRGIPLLTAAQTNPTSFLRALETNRYPLRAIADTSEAERSSDFLMFLLRRPEDSENNEIQAGILKYRDGESDVFFTFEERFDQSYIGDRSVVDAELSTWEVQ